MMKKPREVRRSFAEGRSPTSLPETVLPVICGLLADFGILPNRSCLTSHKTKKLLLPTFGSKRAFLSGFC